MSNREKMLKRLYVSKCISMICVLFMFILSIPAFCNSTIEVTPKIAETLSGLPVQVLLALITLSSLAYSYKVTMREISNNERYMNIIQSLSNKLDDAPCAMTHEEKIDKFCRTK